MKEDLENFKEDLKHSNMELGMEERESMSLHKEIVNTKSKINIVKEYGKKIKDQINREKIVVSDGFRSKKRMIMRKRREKEDMQNKIVLQEDLDALREELRELEAERDHLSAINDIDK